MVVSLKPLLILAFSKISKIKEDLNRIRNLDPHQVRAANIERNYRVHRTQISKGF